MRILELGVGGGRGLWVGLDRQGIAIAFPSMTVYMFNDYCLLLHTNMDICYVYQILTCQLQASTSSETLKTVSAISKTTKINPAPNTFLARPSLASLTIFATLITFNVARLPSLLSSKENGPFHDNVMFASHLPHPKTAFSFLTPSFSLFYHSSSLIKARTRSEIFFSPSSHYNYNNSSLATP